MKKFICGILAAAMTLALAGCAKDTEETIAATVEPSVVSIDHSLGTTKVPFDPQKIAVLDLAALDIIDVLGVGDRVVGIPKSSSVSYLKSYVENDKIVNVGSVKEVDMEALNALQPDLIFIGGRLSSEYENISKIAPTISINIDNEAGYMKSFTQNVNHIASIFGLEEKAVELTSSFDQRIAALNQTASGKKAIVGLVTSGSLSTLGNGSRCSVITNEVGFENAATDVDSTHGDTASFELLLEKDPDYIFILDRDTAINAEGAKVAKEVMENEIVMKTTAYQNGKIIYLTPDVWYLSEGGITATDIMLKDLETGILSE